MKPGFDVEGVHFGPKDGVQDTYSNRDILQELAKIVPGFETSDKGALGRLQLETQLKPLAQILGLDPGKYRNRYRLMRAIGDECGFDQYPASHTFDHTQLWKILEEVKDRVEN